jgi:sec-independent protein translocase protein TatA
MMGLGPMELIVCLIIVVILFGVKRLPELGSGLGQGISNFKKAYRDGNAIDVTPEKSEQNTKENEKKE